MNDDRDLDQLLDAWLEAGPTAAPARVAEAARLEVRSARQLNALETWALRRMPSMNTAIRFVLATAAVAVVAVIGFSLLVSGGPGLGGSRPDGSPTPTPTVTSTPEPTAAPTFPPSGALAVGRHSIPIELGRMIIQIETSGWVSNGSFAIDKGQMDGSDSAGFIFWTESAPDNVYADPCSQVPLSPPAGPSASELATAVSTIPGVELVSGPTEVSVGGYPAYHVAITIPDQIACEPSEFQLWYDDSRGSELARYASQVGSTIHSWIVDVDGTLAWIDGETYASSSPQAAEEIQQIADSIRFRFTPGPG